MQLPTTPVTLQPDQINALNDHLRKTRHGINNSLTLIVAAAELAIKNPGMSDDMLEKIAEQAKSASANIQEFSEDFHQSFGIVRS